MLHKLHDLLGLRTGPRIFFISALIIVIFVVGTIAFTGHVDAFFAMVSGWILENLGWFYILGVSVFLIFLIYMAVSRFGRVRLGPDNERPEHSGGSWFGMLFAAGIGTILMFWGVAEPISHFANPPRQGVEPGSVEAANEAMAFTLYHFGLHTWTIFTLPALAFAYFIYKRNLPPRVSSIFQPLLGEKIHGPIGQAIDIAAVVGTMFGVAVSIGLGTLQINSGLSSLFGLEESAFVQVILIASVTMVAIVSVSLGLDRGIKRLSNFNIMVAVALLVFVLVTGPTLYLIKGTVESAGLYLSFLPELMFWNDTFANTGWQGSWTVFYWAWTISWSPFVGIFIARISRGRTIRQFVTGVLAIPTLFSLVWFGIFGMASFDIERNGNGGLAERVVGEGDIPGALFAFLENFPFTAFVSGAAIFIVVIFFTTSADSASLVIDTMCNGHEDFSPLRQRIFWAATIGVVAATLLAASGAGGLEALQQVIIVVGLPFFIMGYMMIYSLLRALREDAGEVPPIRTRRWRKVLPPEEHERRTEEGNAEGAVVAPEPMAHKHEPGVPEEEEAGPLPRKTGSKPLHLPHPKE